MQRKLVPIKSAKELVEAIEVGVKIYVGDRETSGWLISPLWNGEGSLKPMEPLAVSFDPSGYVNLVPAGEVAQTFVNFYREVSVITRQATPTDDYRNYGQMVDGKFQAFYMGVRGGGFIQVEGEPSIVVMPVGGGPLLFKPEAIFVQVEV